MDLGYLHAGQRLFSKDKTHYATITIDGYEALES